jgi:hypothetical protein
MRVLTYAGSEFLIGNDVAAAVMRYSEALAEAHTAGSIEIPVVDRNGSVTMTTFLVGPASQIVSAPVDSQYDDPVDPDVVEHLDGLTRALRPHAVTEAAGPEPAEWDDAY